MSINIGSTGISNVYLGSNPVTAIYLGGTLAWSPVTTIPIGPNTVYLGGLGGLTPPFTQTDLEGKLTDETINYFVSNSGNVYASSSTDFAINSNAFRFSNDLISYQDGGRAYQVGSYAFNSTYNLTSATLPSASVVGLAGFAYSTNLVSASLGEATILLNSVFQGCTALRYLNIPKIQSIGANAFNGASNLQSIVLPTLTTITGQSAFQNCTSLQTASFNQLQTLPNVTFYSCTALVSASLPVITSIGTNAFGNCTSLVTASFPNVTTIGSTAFSNCYALKEVNLPSWTGSFPNSYGAFQQCSALVSASFPSLQSIPTSTFYNNVNLQYVDLPALTGSNALGGSPATSTLFQGVSPTGIIKVPSDYLTVNGGRPDGDLQYLQDAGFNKYWTVQYYPTDRIFIGGVASTIDLPALASKLTGETLYNYVATADNSISVSSSTNYSINASAFYSNPNITSYVDGGRCTSIELDAFSYSGIQTASFANVTTVSNNAFNGCPLAILNMPKLVTAAYSAFEGTAISTANLQELITVGDRAFLGCYALQNIAARKVTSIGQYAFANDTQLTSVAFPNAASVGLGAFFVNTSLNLIDLSGLEGPNALGGSPGNNNVFYGLPAFSSNINNTITVPSYLQYSNGGSIDGDVYHIGNTLGWQVNFQDSDIIQIAGLGGILSQSELEGKLTGETISLFRQDGTTVTAKSSTNYTLTSTTTGDQFNNAIVSYEDYYRCTAIGDNAFYNRTNLTRAIFKKATSIGSSAFYGCTLLSNTVFPLVTSVGDSAFRGSATNRIDGYRFPSLQTVGDSAFRDAYLFDQVIDDYSTIKTIGTSAFKGCSRLNFIYLPVLQTTSNGLGSSVTDDTVFNGVNATIPFGYSVAGTAYFPSYYATCNNGNPHASIAYLTSISWEVSYL